MSEHFADKTEKNGTIVSGHTRVEHEEDADDVDVDELVRQLSEMERVDEIRITTDNGYFESVSVVFNTKTVHNMVAEVAYSHGLSYWHSNVASDDRHTVTFITDVMMSMRAGTARETYAQYGPPEENPMGEAYTM